ncbi:TPA: hypothetical protein ACQ8JS_003097 [Klebsiella pneumoniae]
MDNNLNLLRRLKRNRQYRQIVDEYESGKSSFVIARKFLLPPEEAAILCLIIEKLKSQENYNNE